MNAEEEPIDLKLYMFSPELLNYIWVPLGIDLTKLRKFKELVKPLSNPTNSSSLLIPHSFFLSTLLYTINLSSIEVNTALTNFFKTGICAAKSQR